MEWLFAPGIGVLFAVWHSFADALAWRIYTAYYSPRRKSVENKLSFILYQSSRCEYCEAHVPWYALIPIAGFFLTGRKCHNCTRPVSWRFPIFEALAFIYGLAVGAMNAAPGDFAVILIAYALLWIVITVDYHMLLIPTEAILGLLVLGIFNLLVVRYPRWFLFDNFDLGLDLAVSFVWYFFFHPAAYSFRVQDGFGRCATRTGFGISPGASLCDLFAGFRRGTGDCLLSAETAFDSDLRAV